MKLALNSEEDLAVCLIEPLVDRFKLSIAADGFVGNASKSVILTFTESGCKHVEIVIPEKVWQSFANAIRENGQPEVGTYSFDPDRSAEPHSLTLPAAS